MLTVGSLFSGIGGIDLGLERAGMKVLWQVEIDAWCRAVLAKHWPDVERFEDVRDVGAHNLLPVDVLAGGFPCQPVSSAGKRRAQDDSRWLWPDFSRLVRELRPRYVFVENVPGLLARGIHLVLGDLAASGYDAEWQSIPAQAVGAPHSRDRVWIVAYANGGGLVRGKPHLHAAERNEALAGLGASREAVADTASPERRASKSQGMAATTERAAEPRERRSPRGAGGDWWRVEPTVGRVADGIPGRVDRLRGLGNAVVPQVVEWIGRRIVEAEEAA